MLPLSVAIPYHGDRWRFVERTLRNLKDDPRIAEVVIVDDHSGEDDYASLIAGVKDAGRCGFPILVYRNDSNLFVYRNKKRAVSLCSSEWVCLLDSDNVIDSGYLDRWEDAVLDGDPMVVYLPELGRPTLDYSEWAGSVFHAGNVAEFIDRKHFDRLLNTCNFVVNRSTFTQAVAMDDAEPFTADSIWINYLLLSAGAMLLVTPGMSYEHTVHAGSTWKLHHRKGDAEFRRIKKLLRSMSACGPSAPRTSTLTAGPTDEPTSKRS